MAETLKIRKGTKMHIAQETLSDQEPKFSMLCTFNKALDASASVSYTHLTLPTKRIV